MQEKRQFIENKGQFCLNEGKAQKIKTHRWQRIYALTVFSLLFVTFSAFFIGGLMSDSLGGFFDDIAQSLLSVGFFGDSANTDTEPPVQNEPESEAESEVGSEKESEKLPVVETLPESDVESGEPETEEVIKKDPYSFDYSLVPNGETAIIPMDLSLHSNGVTYINNSTGYDPDVKELLKSPLKSGSLLENIAKRDEPQVLILHTHATEAYSPEGAISYLDDGGEIARSDSKEENVVAVGALMAEIFEREGIETVHCTIMHDRVQYRDSYSRAEATIRSYLEKYPSIKLVIDVHRDAVMKSNGELVRPVTLVHGEETAQVMCVVGSDWGGDKHDNWQNNLSLALKLREKLNSEYVNLCRPTDLRPNTYNQELSSYSLLLEIGSCGNSLSEALRAAELVAYELIGLIAQM